MSQTYYVERRGSGFWAYDVALAIFLKYLIDAAEPRIAALNEDWLREAVAEWRVVAVGGFGVIIADAWSATQTDLFTELAEQACNALEIRERLSACEITGWVILDDLRIFPRGATEILTEPVVELGRAIVALANESLPAAPPGTGWLYGVQNGPVTVRYQPPSGL